MQNCDKSAKNSLIFFKWSLNNLNVFFLLFRTRKVLKNRTHRHTLIISLARNYILFLNFLSQFWVLFEKTEYWKLVRPFSFEPSLTKVNFWPTHPQLILERFFAAFSRTFFLKVAFGSKDATQTNTFCLILIPTKLGCANSQ